MTSSWKILHPTRAAKLEFSSHPWSRIPGAGHGRETDDEVIEVLGVPTDDYVQIHQVLPRHRYHHIPALLGQKCSDDMILLGVTFITGRAKYARLALLKSLSEKIVAAVTISPGDLVDMLHETAGQNASFGSDLAPRAHLAAQR